MGHQQPNESWVTVPLDGGLQLKVDGKNAPIGTMQRLTNVLMTSPGRLDPRPGWIQLPSRVEGEGYDISAAQAIIPAGDELLLFDGSRGYSWNPGSATWLDKGHVNSAQVTDDQVHHGSTAATVPDCAVLNGLRLSVWIDADLGLCYTLQAESTGAFIQANVQLDVTAIWARCCILGGKLTVIWAQWQKASGNGLQLGSVYAAQVSGPTVPLLDNVIQIATLPNRGGGLQQFFGAPIAFCVNPGLNGGTAYMAWTVQSVSTNQLQLQCMRVSSLLTALGPFDVATVDASAPLGSSQMSACSGLAFDQDNNLFAYVNELNLHGSPAIASSFVFLVSPDLVLLGSALMADSSTARPWFLSTLAKGVQACLPANAVGYLSDPATNTVRFLASWLTYPCSTPGDPVSLTGGSSPPRADDLLVSPSGAPAAAYQQQSSLQPVGQVTYSFTVTAKQLLGQTVAPVHGNWLRGAQVASDLFQQDGAWYVAVAHLSQLQPTLFVVTADQDHVVATIDRPGTLGGMATVGYMGNPTTSPNGPGLQFVAQPLASANTATDGTELALQDSTLPPGVGTVTFALQSNGSYNSVTIDQSTYVVGGHGLKLYDGTGFTEQGFYLYPEGAVAVTGSMASSSPGLSSGSYVWSVCYLWTDNDGNQSRSAPVFCPGIEIEPAQVAAGKQVRGIIFAPVLDITDRDPSSVNIELYRTTAGGATSLSYLVATVPNVATPKPQITGFNLTQRVPSLIAGVTDLTDAHGTSPPTWPAAIACPTGEGPPSFGDGSSTLFYALDFQDCVVITDALPDDLILSNRTLYTEGGAVAPYMPAPPCGIVATFQSRAFVAGVPGDPYGLYFSNQGTGFDTGQALQFNALNRLELDSDGGAITALGVVNNQLIIFKERAIYALNGQGPDAGGNNPYPQPSPVASDVGCVGQQTVKLISNLAPGIGLSFMSAKGLYCIDGSGALSYFGAPVEPFVVNSNLSFDACNVTSAVLVPDQNVVRYSLAAPPLRGAVAPGNNVPRLPNQGSMLCYNYLINQWSEFTGLDAVGSCLWQDVHVLAKRGGRVWFESPDELNLYSDPYGTYGQDVRTNWISPFGQLRMHQVHDVALKFQYNGPAQVQVRLAFDDNPTDNQFVQFDMAPLFTGPPTSNFGSIAASGSAPSGPGVYGLGDPYDPNGGPQLFGMPSPFGFISPFGTDPSFTSGSTNVYGTTTTGSIPYNPTFGAPWFSRVLVVRPNRPCFSMQVDAQVIASGSSAGVSLQSVVIRATDQSRLPPLPQGQMG